MSGGPSTTFAHVAVRVDPDEKSTQRGISGRSSLGDDENKSLINFSEENGHRMRRRRTSSGSSSITVYEGGVQVKHISDQVDPAC